MVTKAKIRHIIGSEAPALIDRGWLGINAGLGTSSLIKLEKLGILEPVKIPGIRGVKYRSAQALPALGIVAASDESVG